MGLMICSQSSGGLKWGAWKSFLESKHLDALNAAAHETLDAVIKRQDRRETAEMQRKKHERHLEAVMKREQQRRKEQIEEMERRKIEGEMQVQARLEKEKKMIQEARDQFEHKLNLLE